MDPQTRTRETTAVVTGLALAGLALFCGLSLYSYAPADVMDYEASSGGQIANLCGLLGARVAHHLLCLYGLGAWVIAFSLLVFGTMIVAARSFSGMILRAVGAILLTALVCTWAGTLTQPADRLVLNPGTLTSVYPAGSAGLVGGSYLAPPLVAYFGKVGIYLVLVAAGLLAGLLIAQDITERAMASVGRGTVHLAQWAWTALAEHLTPAASQAGPVLAPVVATAGSPSARFARAVNNETETSIPALGDRNDRIAVAEAAPAATRRLRGPLVETQDPSEEEKAPKGKNRISADTLKEAAAEKERKAAAEAKAAQADQETREAEEARKRHEDAMQQAEAAEKDRLKREQEAKAQAARETKALEKLEKERAAQEKEKEKARAKFLASMGQREGKSEGAGTGEEASGAQAPAPPRLPDDYKLPDYQSLEAKDIAIDISSEALKERGAKLIMTLREFNIGSRLVGIQHGPAVTMYEMALDPGIKVQRVIGLSDNLSMAMKSEHGVRIIAPLPGRDTIGIEIPNSDDYVVRMRPILESTAFRAGQWTLPLVLGRDATGNPLVTDLARMPHLLIAGTTGSGKSVCVNSIILSLMILRRPHEVKLILVDPKQVEMTDFKGIPHLLSPVVSDMKLAAGVLTWAVQKMEERYERMSKVGVRNISTFNKMSREERLARLPQDEPPDAYLDPMPYIVVVVDEFADLMMSSGKEIEQAIARLAQKARAAGVHVILATQRPSADVVTGLIKTNLPCRICFQVKSKVDSRIVLDSGGADKLAGKGDMLFIPPGSSQLIRAKGVFIADHEIRAVVDFCKGQAQPIYSDEIEQVARQAAQGEAESDATLDAMPLDDKFDEAVECFLAVGRASTSLLQRRMGLGYTRAAKLCDQMEARGIVGPDRGAKGRELQITQDGWEAYKKGNLAQGAWGPRGSADNPIVAPETAGPAPVALLDDVDGTREPAGESAEDVSEVASPADESTPAMVAQLDDKTE